MKTVLMVLLVFVVLYVICFLIGFIGCIWDGRLVFQNWKLVALDHNGQVIQPTPQVKPTEVEIKQMQAEHQENKSSKAGWLCLGALGCFLFGGLSGKPQLHAAGLILLFGALLFDYRTFFAALLCWYVILPALVVMVIAGVLKRN